MTKIREPFTAWMDRDGEVWNDHEKKSADYYSNEGSATPVLVTPLVEGEPRVGETWVWIRSQFAAKPDVTVVIRSAVVRSRANPGCAMVELPDGSLSFAGLNALRPVPKLRTYRLARPDRPEGVCFDALGDLVVRAESKDAALAKIADALECVEGDDG